MIRIPTTHRHLRYACTFSGPAPLSSGRRGFAELVLPGNGGAPRRTSKRGSVAGSALAGRRNWFGGRFRRTWWDRWWFGKWRFRRKRLWRAFSETHVVLQISRVGGPSAHHRPVYHEQGLSAPGAGRSRARPWATASVVDSPPGQWSVTGRTTGRLAVGLPVLGVPRDHAVGETAVLDDVAHNWSQSRCRTVRRCRRPQESVEHRRCARV
jgi:hypothetical protein